MLRKLSHTGNLLRELADAAPAWSWMNGEGVRVLGPSMLNTLSTCDIFSSPWIY